MAKTGMILSLVGGIVAVIAQFWSAGVDTYYLPLIGGVLAIIGALMK